MKILIIGERVKSSWHVATYTGMWTYHLPLALQSLGCEIGYFPRYQTDQVVSEYINGVLDAAQGYDAILATGVRYWTMIPRQIGETLRGRFDGWVAQIHDGSMLDGAPCDLTFTVRDDAWKFKGNPGRIRRHNAFNVHVGWAGNPDLFYPESDHSATLRIFIDHGAIDVSGVDHSLTIQRNLTRINRPFVARTLTDEGLQTIDPNNIVVRPYHRTPVPATEFAAELRKSDVFFVTHRESLGLSVLEAAMCGALIACPPDTIALDRLATVNHVIIDSKIDWTPIYKGIDRKANAERVSECTWTNVATRIVRKLQEPKPTA